MTPKLSNTDDLRKALNASQGSPVEVEDDQTHTIYVIVPREEFQKRYKSVYDASEPKPEEFYPLIDEAFGGPDGWDAPGMELYDDYDSHRQQS